MSGCRHVGSPAAATQWARRGVCGVALVFAALAGVAGAGAQVEAWRARFNRGIDGEAYLGDADYRRNKQSLVVDQSGNTFVADSVHDGSTWNFLVAKHGPDGTLLWSATIDSPSAGAQQDFPTSLALDSFGNVFVTGYSSGNPGGTDLLTAKLNSLGLQQWAVLHNGVGNPEEWGRAIAVDSAGSVFVAGERNSNANDFLIVKYGAGGALLWSATFDGATHGEERLFGLAVDENGSPYVTGWSRDAVSGVSDFMTVRWSTAGSQLWAVPFDNPALGQQEDWAYGLTLDVAGNAYVVGGSNSQFMTVKYDSAGVVQWATSFGGVSQGEAYAVAVDAIGEVLVTGSGISGSSGWDLVTVKYDSAGGQQWAAISENPEPGVQLDFAFAIASDPFGNVCVVGHTQDPVTTRYDYLTAKYDASGVVLWVRAFDNPLVGSQDDFGSAVGMDMSGNVLIGGRSYGSTWDARIVKYNPAGTELWTTIEPPSRATTDRVASETNQFARRGVAVDSAGRVAVTGLANDASNFNDFMTVRYGPNGARMWAAAFENPAAGFQHDQAVAVAVDGDGNTYVTGQSFNGANWDYMTVKYDAAGVQQWATPFNGAFNSQDTPSAIAVDAGGDVYVTGQSVSATGYDYLTVKYNALGVQQWASSYNGPGSNDEYPYALHVDAAGNVCVTGAALRSATGWDVMTVKYDSAGVQQWAVPFAGAFNYDVGYAVSADAVGNVYVSGYSQIDSSTGDALTVKYDASGVQQWARTWENPAIAVQHDMTYSHALDASGNLYATGFSGSVGTGLYDYLTLKYDASGTLQWAQTFENPAAGSQDDTAFSIALDGGGSVYVVGRSHNGANHDLVTVRYDSAGVQQWSAAIDNGGHDYGTSMAAGPNGSIVVAGTSDGLGQDYVVAKYVAAESTPPVDPAIDSASPPASTWSKDNTVQVSWSGATDNPAGSGLAGYSVEWNHAATSTPDAVVDIPHTSDPYAATSPALVPDGNDWYFHLRTCDVAGNCTSTVHAGPFWIDTMAPPGAPGLVSGSHVVGVPSEADTISMSWNEPTDAGSGIDGYSWAFTGGASWTCETTKEAEEGTTGAISSPLAAGGWYFHLCARDNAGSWGAVVTAGPFQITDTALPTTCALPFERKWGSFGTAAGQFRRPFGVGAGPGGEVVVADFDNGRLQLFDNLGNFVRQWSTAGGPVSVALDSHGHAVVSNLYAGNVQVFALDGTLVDQWATGSPYGLTVDATDHVYAVNDTANVVTKYDHDGNVVLQFGSAGAGNGQFLRAWGVATAPGGDVFVTDINGHSVQRFTAAGAFLGKWGSYGAGAGQLSAPAGISISPTGVVYVSEVANRRIQAFTLEGFPLCARGSSGSGDGQFSDPLNVAFSTGHLYVADHLNHRIQKFGLDEIPPTNPSISSMSPGAGTWSNDNTVQVTWSGAADNLGGSGLAGYSFAWTLVFAATDAIVDLTHGADPHSTTSAALVPDGSDWNFRLRTCDNAGNCSGMVQVGPFWIDTASPSPTGVVSSISHGDGLPKSDPTIEISWGAASDGLSGVASYRYGFTATSTPPACGSLGTTTVLLAGSSGSLADGIWYAHVCAVDRAGNLGAVTAGGPYLVDTTAPTGLMVSSSSHTVSTWSSDAAIEFAFSGATDTNGVAGYAVVFDTAAGTVPACAATQAGQSFTGTASPDGSGWRLHVRAIDAAGNCGGTNSFGPFWIDTVAPPVPGTVVSPSHGGGATNDPTIDAEWGPSSAGAGAPIAGYRFDFWSGAVPPACSALTGTSAGTSASSPALGEGDWYLSVCAVDGAGNESPVTTGGPYTIDTSGPTGLLVASTSHALATWSSAGDVDFAFSGAIDPNGVAGYSIAFDQAAATVPDSTPEQAGTTFTGTASPDSADWYLHVRACDSAGNCSAAVHAGPYWIDTGTPSAPDPLTSASHGDGEPHSDATVAIGWGAASDVLSGVAFYRYDFTALPGAPDCATLVATTPDLTATSGSLADGAWYAHVCAVDAAGNRGAVASDGPYRIDTAPPTVEAFDSVARTADLVLTEGEVVDQPMTQVYVRFAEEMFDPPGDTTPGDVTHPAGWLLVASGPDGIVDSAGCTVAGDDIALPLAVTWSAATRTAHLAPDGDLALAAGRYLVAACGTLLDPAGNPLDGDGNGSGGDARARTFGVRGTDLAGNPNFDAGLAGWTVVATVPGEVAADPDDAGEQPTSGSVAVTSSSGAGETWQVEQCVVLPAHGWSRLSGSLRSASALAGAPVAHLEAQYFGAADCSSGALSSLVSPAVAGDTGAAWVAVVTGGAPFPAGAHSASVRLIVDAGATNDVDLHADELFFGDDGLLFADGFESGGTGSWSSAMP